MIQSIKKKVSHTANSLVDSFRVVAVDSPESQMIVDLECTKQLQDGIQNDSEGLLTVNTHIQALRHVSYVAVTMLLISKKNCCPPQ